MRLSSNSRNPLWLVSAVLFVASLFGQTFYLDQRTPHSFGLGGSVLLMGWLGFLMGEFAWLANPLFVAGWILFYRGRIRAATICSSLALAVMAAFLLERNFPIDESGAVAHITAYGSGFWLWLISGVCLLIAAMMTAIRARRTA